MEAPSDGVHHLHHNDRGGVVHVNRGRGLYCMIEGTKVKY